MRSSSCSSPLVLGSLALLVGCASPAPELPRHVVQVSDPGFASTTPLVSAASLSERRSVLVTRSVWDVLSDEEQKTLNDQYQIKLLEDDQFGQVMDVQGVDQSSPGTNAGAVLGGSVASAAYLDRGLRGHNYSASGALAIGLLGAVVGSSMDQQAVARFQFRYTVRLGDGEVKYFDEIKTTQFRHSPGVCVTVPEMNLISQQVCNQSPDAVRKRYLRAAAQAASQQR